MTELPPELVSAWETAQAELTAAKLNYAKPRMDDGLEEVRVRLAHAHAGVAKAYDAILVEGTLPDVLVAALHDASEFHRTSSADVPVR